MSDISSNTIRYCTVPKRTTPSYHRSYKEQKVQKLHKSTQTRETQVLLKQSEYVSRSEGTIFNLQHYTTETEHSKISFASSCCNLKSCYEIQPDTQPTHIIVCACKHISHRDHASQLTILSSKKPLESFARYLQFVV